MNIKRYIAKQLQSAAEELNQQADAEDKRELSVVLPFTPFVMCDTPAPIGCTPESSEPYHEWVFNSVFNQLKRQQGPKISCEATFHGPRIVIDQCRVNFVWNESQNSKSQILQLEALHGDATAIKRGRWFFSLEDCVLPPWPTRGWSAQNWRDKNIREIVNWILELHTRFNDCRNPLALEYLAFHLPSYFKWSPRILPESKFWQVIGKRKNDCDATRQIIKLGLDQQRSKWTNLLNSQFGVSSTGVEESNPTNPTHMTRLLAALNAAKEAKPGDPETCFLWLQFPREKVLQFMIRQDVEIDEVSMPCSPSRIITNANNFEWNDAHAYAFVAFAFLSACKGNLKLKMDYKERMSWRGSNLLPLNQVLHDAFGESYESSAPIH